MIKKLILASRPKTLPASLGPVILGNALAFSTIGKINYTIALLTGLCAVFLQISTNLVNDYYDAVKGVDSEQRLGPKRVTATGELSPKLVKYSFVITLIISFLLGVFLMKTGGVPIIIIGISSLLCAYAYTGGPFPLSYYALGEVFALIFFGPVAVWGSYYLQTGAHHPHPIIIGLAPGLISAAIMAINNLRDRQTDIKTTKLTLAIILGPKGARALPLIFVLLSTFIPIIDIVIFKRHNLVLFATFSSYLFTKNWLALAKEPVSEKFNLYLANTGKYLFVFCLIYSIALIKGH